MNLVALTSLPDPTGRTKGVVVNMDFFIGARHLTRFDGEREDFTSVFLATGGGGSAASYGFTEYRVQEMPSEIKYLAENKEN